MKRLYIFVLFGPLVGLLVLYCIPPFFGEIKPVNYFTVLAIAMQYPIALLLGLAPAFLVYLFDDRLQTAIPLWLRAPACFFVGYAATYLLLIVPGLPLWLWLGFIGGVAGLVCSLLSAWIARS